MLYLIMGVTGVGKSETGRALALALNATFIEADDFHSPENKSKMQQGQPLTDEDRQAWLSRLVIEIEKAKQQSRTTVLACSALKQAYRDQLLRGTPAHRMIWLHAPRSLIAQRLAARSGHFMHPALLDSQLAILEPPLGALTLSAERQPAAIVSEILKYIQ